METLLTEKSKSQYMKTYAVSEGKSGKTTFLACSCLGVLPGQTGPLVTSPSHLTIVAVDSGAVVGLKEFIRDICKREDALTVNVINMADQVNKAMSGDNDWQYGFYEEMVKTAMLVKSKARERGGVNAVIISSLTGVAETIKRSLTGKPNAAKRGGGMDQAKWQEYDRMLVDIRNHFHSDYLHTFWEGHVYKAGTGDDAHDEAGVSGKTGRNWGFNVEQVFRLRREMTKYPGTLIDKVAMDTRPSLDFTAGGRGFTGVLEPKEYDLVAVAQKLGYKTAAPADRKEEHK